VSLVVVGHRWVITFLLPIPPNGPADPLLRLPFVPGVYMTVEDVQRVAENLVIDTSQTIVATRRLHSLANQREVKEEDFPPLPVEVGQMVHGLVVAKQQRITRKVLSITDHREATGHSRHDHRILAAEGSGDGWIASVHLAEATTLTLSVTHARPTRDA
jgi:hypothetical protein